MCKMKVMGNHELIADQKRPSSWKRIIKDDLVTLGIVSQMGPYITNHRIHVDTVWDGFEINIVLHPVDTREVPNLRDISHAIADALDANGYQAIRHTNMVIGVPAVDRAAAGHPAPGATPTPPTTEGSAEESADFPNIPYRFSDHMRERYGFLLKEGGTYYLWYQGKYHVFPEHPTILTAHRLLKDMGMGAHSWFDLVGPDYADFGSTISGAMAVPHGDPTSEGLTRPGDPRPLGGEQA